MGRPHTSSNTATTQTAAQDLIQLLAASNVHVIVHQIVISCNLTTDERNLIKIHRGTAAGGTAGTENPLGRGTVTGDALADSVVTFNDTTQNSEGLILHEEQWSCLTPFIWLPTPTVQIHVPGGASLTIELDETITSCSISSTIQWEELG